MNKILIICTIIFLFSITCHAQGRILKTTVTDTPCTTDTIKGILYRSMEYGSCSIEAGYYIAICGGIQIGSIPFMGQEDAPIWIPGRYLRRDEVDKNHRLVHNEFQEQFNTGYFTDENFKRVKISSVYGLLVYRKKAF